MKQRFDFCHCVGLIQPDTQFVAVWFGSSRRDQQILKRLEPLRFQRDVYFERHTPQVADFLDRVARSLFPNCALPLLRLCSSSMSASDFLRYLADNEIMPRPASKRVFATLQHLDPRFYAKTCKL